MKTIKKKLPVLVISAACLLFMQCHTRKKASTENFPPAKNWDNWALVSSGLTTAQAPACANYRGNQFLFTVSDKNNKIGVNSYDNKNWSGWAEVAGEGTTDASLSAAEYIGKLFLFSKGINDHGVYFNQYDNSKWSGWSNLPAGGTTNSALNAINYGGYLYLFRQGDKDSIIYFTRLTNTSWFRSWIKVPGNIKTNSALNSVMFNKTLFLFAKEVLTSRIFYTSFDGYNWSKWRGVPGLFTTTDCAPAAVSDGEHLYLFCKTISGNNIYLNLFDGHDWVGWKLILGNGSSPGVAVAANMYKSKIYLFRRDAVNREVYEIKAPIEIPRKEKTNLVEVANVVNIRNGYSPKFPDAKTVRKSDPEEADFISHTTNYPAGEIMLDQSSSHEFSVQISGPTTLVAISDSYGSDEPLNMTIKVGGSNVANGLPSKIDTDRGTVGASVHISQACTAIIQITNSGSKKVKAQTAINSFN